MTNAEAWFNIALRPRKPEGSLGRTAQDGHIDSHTAPELCINNNNNDLTKKEDETRAMQMFHQNCLRQEQMLIKNTDRSHRERHTHRHRHTQTDREEKTREQEVANRRWTPDPVKRFVQKQDESVKKKIYKKDDPVLNSANSFNLFCKLFQLTSVVCVCGLSLIHI